MDTDLKALKNFNVTVYGDLEPYNDVITKARVRIFYKYSNRNGTYITDEFAEKLLASLPYTPVKGIYDGDDYTDHGYSRSLGRIFGIVPENPNIRWEKHLDSDGVEREYACADVYLFTALYSEAGDIVGKAQSMELYDKSIEGNWAMIQGQKHFVFTDGCFIGLQVLGEEVEPCFEGAAFFTLYESLTNMIKKIEAYNLSLDNLQGGKDMPHINYKLSDNEKHYALWSLLNANFTEEGNWAIEYDICDVYDEYAVVKNYNEGCFERVYYTKDDATDTVVLGQKKKCYIMDVTEEEKMALDALHALTGTYEKVDETYSAATQKVEELTNANSEFELKITELTGSIDTLTMERDEARTQFSNANTLLDEAKTNLETAQNNLASLQADVDSLTEYKHNVERNEKLAILDSYADMLSEEIRNSFAENLDNYTAIDLDKELAYALKKANPTVFTKNPAPVVIPKDNLKGGIEEILSKYENR